MATVQSSSFTAPPDATRSRPEITPWVGVVVFAGVMLTLGGVMQGFYGLVAIINDQWPVYANQANLLLGLTAWGWIHLVLGVIALIAGVGIVMGSALARGIGVIVAGVSMVVTFMSLPAEPLWSLTIIAVDLVIIYALIAHGREARIT
jgi:hypothetical protein